MSDDEGPRYTKGHHTHKSLKAHWEINFRCLVDGLSGVYFREKIVQARLEPRLGGDD